MSTSSIHRHTTGHIYLGLKNRLKLLRLALSFGKLATIHTRYEESITVRKAECMRESDVDGDIERDNAVDNPMSGALRILEMLILFCRGVAWVFLVAEILLLDGPGVILALIIVWAVYLPVGRVIEMEFGKSENYEQND